ncbi:hypothetical protein ONA22_05690 [Mycoplasmopsis cynos]|uniref:hypothetical protein n=1 Tax=Mycoplasmopsis cynos TaxID=171284 RepID=UPI0024CA7D2F|nr:hypothetical protein [Mycoplasmopsis cynos]WAM03215.1 hypothetical protein ONA22_05690 [Mycoplasmopsis cynos]
MNDETNFDEDDEDENKSTIKYDLLEDGINQDSIGNLWSYSLIVMIKRWKNILNL